jgi:hypothetical protein
MRIPAQDARIEISGRYIKNQQFHNLSLPQQTNTLGVHNSIGVSPVLDQHEISRNLEYANSIRGLWITGTMTVPSTGWPRSGSSELIQGDNTLRKAFGSVIDGTSGDMASLQRNIRIVDASERYYDSFVPDPLEMWRATGYEPIRVGSGSSQVLTDGAYLLKITAYTTKSAPVGVHDLYDISFGNVYGGTKYLNDTWLHQFPFSSRFASLQRRVRKNAYVVGYDFNTLLTTVTVGELSSSGYPQIDSAAPIDVNFNMITGHRRSSTSTAGTPYSLVGNDNWRSIGSNPANQVLFGIGDNYLGMHRPVSRDPIGTFVSLPLTIVEKPRGYKYGLINANPHPTSAVFRATHYGHLRDMLEQRQYSAITLVNIPEKAQILPTSSTKSAQAKKPTRPRIESPTKFPVEIKFRTPVHENPTLLGSSKDPMSTQSCNLSIYATSSLPYFDDEIVRNRTYPSGTI